ncbi:hypothetical protein C1J03_08905 [Sulfitobacter sp. SK012]|uniref:hypothetical protein n=1 Tax=Sulfitobacter sp. SK012 TaxID=1389005 RepID=UPI000E0C530E|nr:hypothetical protein [Sulfitobacter sp. SK012]AXI46126.1 hypothetical protein C1J03_08905 [Sulfitobacter sp. SK012]
MGWGFDRMGGRVKHLGRILDQWNVQKAEDLAPYLFTFVAIKGRGACAGVMFGAGMAYKPPWLVGTAFMQMRTPADTANSASKFQDA